MYALKKITVTEDGRQVEEVHVLGNMYRLEFYPAQHSPCCPGGVLPGWKCTMHFGGKNG
ncbi:Uncharacterised protein [Escherichia coli]|uniref:Uncharacterized protein n=1 Tax=Escherichia coli TaxID=562 RepID=A0A376KQN3_ECOLX|nr:Uncharacterised protein [Escherichia coli]